MKPVIIAHRGASALATHENSLESFQIAIDLKADYAEFDVRKTLDDKLIVFHDDNYKGHPISKLTYEDLCSLTLQEGLTPPLFSQVLDLCKGKIKLDIELKESGFENEVVTMVTQSFDYDSFMIKSFLDEVPLKIKSLDSRIKTGLLIGKAGLKAMERLREYYPGKRLKRCKADFISPNQRFLTRGFLFRMKICRRDIYVWTVNTPDSIHKLLNKKITGLITDRPDIALKMRKSLV